VPRLLPATVRLSRCIPHLSTRTAGSSSYHTCCIVRAIRST